jgi:hypothetical protein
VALCATFTAHLVAPAAWGLPHSVRSDGMSVDQAWDAYEAAERDYLQALIDEAPKHALIGAAGKARDSATTLRQVAFRDIQAAERVNDDDAWSMAARDCDTAELLAVLWERILAAHQGKLMLPEP